MRKSHRIITLITIMICLLLSACSSISPTATQTLTPIPTLSPTPTLAPTPVPTLSPEQQENLDLQNKLALAPDVEGTTKVIKEINGLKRVVYQAAAGNRFGLAAASYAGEYKKEVSFEGNEIGGIALISLLVEPLLLEEIAKQTDEQGKWLIPLPADISDMKTIKEVKLSLSLKPFFDLPIGINIDCGGEIVDTVNVMPGKTKIIQGVFPANGYTVSTSFLNDESSDVILGKEMDFLRQYEKIIGDAFYANNQILRTGGVLGETSDAISICMAGEGSRPAKISFDKVFKIKNVPVFVVSN